MKMKELSLSVRLTYSLIVNLPCRTDEEKRKWWEELEVEDFIERFYVEDLLAMKWLGVRGVEELRNELWKKLKLSLRTRKTKPLKTLKEGRESSDRILIKKHLSYHHNNVSKAAKTLGIDRGTLYELIKKYEVLSLMKGR